MKILIISDNYPSEQHPTNGVFVYNLVQQFAKLGHEVIVIAPFQLVPRKIKFKNSLVLQTARSKNNKDIKEIETNLKYLKKWQ